MSETKTKFRTNQEQYFEPDEHTDDLAPPTSNAKFIGVVALGVLVAAVLATLLSVTF
jgi:hypothetical protein